MEKIHKTASRRWISDPVSVKQFCDEWTCRIPKSECLALIPSERTPMECSDSASECSELEKQCGMEAMRCTYQHMLEISKEVTIPEDVHLETLNFQKEDIEKQKEDTLYEKAVYLQLKECSYPRRKIAGSDDASLSKFEPVEDPNVLLRVQIYKPEQRNNIRMLFAKCQVDQEFMVLGSQYLTELRDKIICVSDKAVPGDYSEMPHEPLGENCGEIYKSGFFYINGAFYNDMRHPECRDYSRNIIDWSTTKAKGVGPFQALLMEETKFMDLTIQLGYPYLYVHQGNCEHLIVFNDLLLYTHHYSNNKFDYPVHVEVKPKRRSVCMVCHIHVAEWIVYDNKRLPVHPFFFCKPCFAKFNYKDDKKVGSFSAYHHFDRSLIL